MLALVPPAFAAEEGATPEIIEILTARLAAAVTTEEALELAEALRQVYGESESATAAVLYTHSVLVFEDEDASSAVYKLSRAIDLDENLVAAYVLRGEIMLSQGGIDGAFNDAMAAAERAPNYYAALGLLGQAFEAQGRNASALIATREALARYPLSEELQIQLRRHEALAAGAGF